MKGTVISMACLATLAFAHSEVFADSLSDIQLTLSSTPSISIDGSSPQSFVDPWGKPHGGKGFVVPKKNSDYRRSFQLFDLPGPGYWRLYHRVD